MDSLKIVVCISLLIIFPNYVSAKCIIHLKNDRTLKADSCQKAGNKIKLFKRGLTFALDIDLVREIVTDKDENHSSKKKISQESKTKKVDLNKKRNSKIEGHDQNRIDKIMKDVGKIKKAYEILDKKPKDF